jgi:hypothetical protein
MIFIFTICFIGILQSVAPRVSSVGCPFFASKKYAKRSEKDAKANSKLARLSETKRNKVRMPQFRLHEPLKTILTHKETCDKSDSFFMV